MMFKLESLIPNDSFFFFSFFNSFFGYSGMYSRMGLVLTLAL